MSIASQIVTALAPSVVRMVTESGRTSSASIPVDCAQCRHVVVDAFFSGPRELYFEIALIAPRQGRLRRPLTAMIAGILERVNEQWKLRDYRVIDTQPHTIQ